MPGRAAALSVFLLIATLCAGPARAEDPASERRIVIEAGLPFQYAVERVEDTLLIHARGAGPWRGASSLPAGVHWWQISDGEGVLIVDSASWTCQVPGRLDLKRLEVVLRPTAGAGRAPSEPPVEVTLAVTDNGLVLRGPGPVRYRLDPQPDCVKVLLPGTVIVTAPQNLPGGVRVWYDPARGGVIEVSASHYRPRIPARLELSTLEILLEAADDPATAAEATPTPQPAVPPPPVPAAPVPALPAPRPRSRLPVIVIDPGHGGGDSGARNRAMGLREKDITLAISRYLKTLLEAAGFDVVLTREGDAELTSSSAPDRVELEARVRKARAAGALLFISIHIDASRNASANGFSIHHCKPGDRSLAEDLRGVFSPLGLRDRGLCRNGFYVLRHSKMKAVLVECAFITNPKDADRIARSDFQRRMAELLARRLEAHVRTRLGKVP